MYSSHFLLIQRQKFPTVHPNPTCSGPAAAARRPGGSAPDGCSSSGPPTAPAPPPHPPTAAAHLPRWSSLLLHCLASEGLRSYFPSKFVHLRQPLLWFQGDIFLCFYVWIMNLVPCMMNDRAYMAIHVKMCWCKIIFLYFYLSWYDACYASVFLSSCVMLHAFMLLNCCLPSWSLWFAKI